MSSRRLVFVLPFLAAAAACSSAEVADDTGPRAEADAAARDAGAVDAEDAPRDASEGAPDALGLDAGVLDALGGPDAAERPDVGTAPPDAGLALSLPPVNGGLDYQLGGPYPPPAGVDIVSRDRTEAPARGLYNICYVNGFQIQPDEVADWTTNHPDLMLRDAAGDLVIDTDWNEILIDVRTPAKRAAVAAIVGGWIRGCHAAGFDAVEIDNLDTYSRSNGLISEDDAVAMIRLLADAAHAEGMAIGQKNSAELVPRRAELDTDFAVVEECNRYDECDVFTSGYGDHVLIIEYRRSDFTAGCAAYPNLSIVLRDRNLVGPGQSGYVYDGC